MRIISSMDSFLKLKDHSLGVSDWLIIDQSLINKFADATLDNQWIHVDESRAKVESPYGNTIAHGYLLVSLIPHFLDQIIKVENLERIVNYGIDKMVFQAPVLVNSCLRMKAHLKSIKDLGCTCLCSIQCAFEIEGKEDPVLEGQIKYLYYLKGNDINNK